MPYSNTKDVAIRIPTENLLQGPGWDRIRKYLRGHFRSLQDALAMGHTAVRVVAAINLMTAALKNLVKLLDYQVPNGHPSQEEGITILLEMIQHRDLIVAARSVLERISPESIVHKQLLFGVEAYESTMRVGFPLIDQLPEQGGLPPEHQLAYSPHAVRENRSRLIDSGFDLLLLLTKIGPVPLPNAA